MTTDPVPEPRQPADSGDGVSSRTPPQDIAAEQCVLGGMMLSKDAIADVVEIVRPGDFYRPAHTAIFDVILDLYGRGEPADAVTVAAALTNAGDLMRVGGAPYLHTLLASVPTAANSSWYARIVADRAQLRRLVEAGTRIVQMGFGAAAGAGRDTDDVVDLAQQTLYDATETRGAGDGFASLADLLQPALDEIERAGALGGVLSGVTTGFGDLDKLVTGWQPGQFVVVGARPSIGKSTALMDFCRAASIGAAPVASAFFSLEMSKVEIVQRLLAAEARVPLQRIRTGDMSDDDWTRLARRMGDIGDSPIFIDDSPNMTLMEIRAKARRLKMLHDIKLIFVDYLQLMTAPTAGYRGGPDNRQEAVASFARGLKLLAKELECTVLTASQLNRGPESRTDKRPQLSDLRESGAVEQDADVVILLDRPDFYDRESPRAGEADFIVAKHRNGPTDTITVAAQLHFSRFVDMAIN